MTTEQHDPYAAQAPQAPQAPSVPSAPPGYEPASVAESMEVEVRASGWEENPQLPEGWWLFHINDDPQDPGVQMGKATKSGNPKVVVKLRAVCDARGDTSKQGMIQWLHLELANPDSNPFALMKFLRQGFGIQVAKGDFRFNFAQLLGKRLWGRVAKQTKRPEYNEVAEYRLESDPPPGAVPVPGSVAAPGPSPAPAESTGITGRI